jgi:hypothetical protein
MSRKQSSWLRLSFKLWEASLEAQQVISLRLAVLAGGSESAGAEAVRMVSERCLRHWRSSVRQRLPL